MKVLRLATEVGQILHIMLQCVTYKDVSGSLLSCVTIITKCKYGQEK